MLAALATTGVYCTARYECFVNVHTVYYISAVCSPVAAASLSAEPALAAVCAAAQPYWPLLPASTSTLNNTLVQCLVLYFHCYNRLVSEQRKSYIMLLSAIAHACANLPDCHCTAAHWRSGVLRAAATAVSVLPHCWYTGNVHSQLLSLLARCCCCRHTALSCCRLAAAC
jgi:hypothetical protein